MQVGDTDKRQTVYHVIRDTQLSQSEMNPLKAKYHPDGIIMKSRARFVVKLQFYSAVLSAFLSF